MLLGRTKALQGLRKNIVLRLGRTKALIGLRKTLVCGLAGQRL